MIWGYHYFWKHPSSQVFHGASKGLGEHWQIVTQAYLTDMTVALWHLNFHPKSAT